MCRLLPTCLPFLTHLLGGFTRTLPIPGQVSLLCHLPYPRLLHLPLLPHSAPLLLPVLLICLRLHQCLLDAALKLLLQLPFQLLDPSPLQQPHVSLAPNVPPTQHVHFQLLLRVFGQCYQLVPSLGKELICAQEVSPTSLLDNPTKAPLELEEVFGKEVIFLLDLSDSLSIPDQLCIDILIVGYSLNLMLFGNDFVLDCFSIEELGLDGIGTPRI